MKILKLLMDSFEVSQIFFVNYYFDKIFNNAWYRKRIEES